MVTALTKFVVPRIPNATIVRDALVSHLANGAACPLTVVAAAPGSGKSALLAQWAHSLTGPVAWMSCDIVDADPAWFWRDLCVAIRQAWGGAVWEEAELVEAREPRELAIEVANELAQSRQPGAIVIDDFHLAAPEPTVMLTFIDALPPSVRLVLGGRDDPSFPLGRLRVQGRLLELRQADLRFTTEEIRLVLTDLGVDLAPDELGRLEDLTEGWAAGVYLAGLSLRATPDPAGMLRRLVDTERSLVDFLMNEVIELQPAELLDFLMVTAQLESFDAALCDAVTGRSDSGGMIDRIRVANLFLVVLDGEGAWYRYHHLFGEFLRARLRVVAPSRVPLIHRVAADAYTERGDLVSAVRHSMAAGDTEAALTHVATHMATATTLGDQNVVGAAARAWLAEFGAAHLQHAPSRILECVFALDATGGSDAAGHWLERVEAREADLDPATRFLLHGAWSFHLLYQGDPAGALSRARSAQAVLREHAVDNMWVPSLPMVLVQAQLTLDDLDGALTTLDALRTNPSQPAVLTEVRRPGYASQAEVLRGDLLAAERLAIQAATAADQLGLPAAAFGRAESALTMAEVALERDQLDAAQGYVEQLMRIVDHGRRPLLELAGNLLFAQLAATRSDDIVVAVHLERARHILP
jgi:LuxR family maltose regulon positive regulatory protein